MLGLEKDDHGIDSGGTLGFAELTGIEIVLDDSDQSVLTQFFPSSRGSGTNNSDFVILNGVAHSPSHELWEVLYTRSRNLFVDEVRAVIDSIEAGTAPLPPPAAPILSEPKWDGHRFHFNVKGTADYSGRVEFSKDAIHWETLQEMEFTGELQSVIDLVPADSSHRFYRVLTLE